MKFHFPNGIAFRLISIAILATILPIACVTPVVPFEKHESGDITHSASGVIFPERLGAFKRGVFEGLDLDGLDVSIAYTRHHLRDRLDETFFVYPAISTTAYDVEGNVLRESRKALLEQSFKKVKQEVMKYTPKAKLVWEDHSVIMFQGQERDALLANFIYSKGFGPFNIQMFTTASLIAVDDWLILSRLTAADDSVGRSTGEISECMQLFMKKNGGRLFKAGYGDGE